jgi:hypothetical protein
MFSNVGLDIFIGLIFVFLLYSLLATILMEFIAHFMGLRPRMLLKSLRRMLEDNPPEIFGRKKGWTILDVFSDTWQSILRYFYPFKDMSLLRRFYQNPTVKYLGESKSSSKPSYMTAANFSQTMIRLLRDNNGLIGQESQMNAIRQFLFVDAEEYLKQYKSMLAVSDIIPHLQEVEKLLADPTITLNEIREKIPLLRTIPVSRKKKSLREDLIKKLSESAKTSANVEAFIQDFNGRYDTALKVFQNRIAKDTLKHLQRLFYEAQNDIDRFNQKLEIWFDETMHRASGWYKRQTQWILLVVGFVIAVWGNVDTIHIYKTLANEKNARDQMVNLAIHESGKYDTIIRQLTDSVTVDSTSQDSVVYRTRTVAMSDTSLQQAKKMVMEDIKNTENILGLGWCSTDSCKKCEAFERYVDSVKKESGKYVDSLKEKINSTKKQNIDSTKKAKSVDSLNGVIKIIDSNITVLEKQCEECYDKFENKATWWSFIGWLLTALAISLGSPFWFDMLNKVMKLRSAGTKPAAGSGTAAASDNTGTATRTPIARKG